MNADELLRELKDPSVWNAQPRAAALPSRRRISPLVVSFVTVATVAVITVVVFGLFSSSIRAIDPPIRPADTPTPTATAGAPYDDDGRVAAEEYANLAGMYSYELGEVDPTGLVSVPWVAMYPFSESTDLYIAVVGGAPDGGDGVTPAPTNDGDECWGRPVGANVVETEGSITITVYSTPPGETVDCGGTPEVAGAHVMFDFPMKDRTLVHGGLSGGWETKPSEIKTKENSNQDHEPSSDPTTPPALQDDVYLTSEGLGDIRIDEPIGSSTIAVWDKDLCGEGGTGSWVLKPPLDAESAGHWVAHIVTDNRDKNASVDHIWVTSPEIPTKSGARVGDTLESLRERFPDLGEPVATEGYDTYAIEGTSGKVLFDVGEPDALGMGEEPNPVVIFIRVIPIDDDPQIPIGDTYGSCSG